LFQGTSKTFLGKGLLKSPHEERTAIHPAREIDVPNPALVIENAEITVTEIVTEEIGAVVIVTTEEEEIVTEKEIESIKREVTDLAQDLLQEIVVPEVPETKLAAVVEVDSLVPARKEEQ
jgi:hypothetical protein